MNGRRRLFSLSLLALGIVYGDIGTSPLYAMRECFHVAYGVPVTPANIYGVLSLIFWTLVIVVTLKYHVYVIRFDNRGEGGILALIGLLRTKRGSLVIAGVFGAALLYGDGMITPAISVLSAVEGLEIATPVLTPYVLPLTIAILVALFMFQSRGTAMIGRVFGPITLTWFVTIAILGIAGIARHPAVLLSVNPIYAVRFFTQNGSIGFLVLGAVFLVATGGEALYADLGHFGEKPIQVDWFCIAGPSLMLQYFGQGALLIEQPAAAVNPFYLLAPRWMLYPLVILATAATIIASQAIVSGAFSLTRQAIQLGYLPRMEVIHTSDSDIGQIYIPAVNRALMIATIVLVVGFGSSSSLAGAYGVAVSTTMLITTVLAHAAARARGWSAALAGTITVGFLTCDVAFLVANWSKIGNGGWFPLVIATVVFTFMTTWRRGREILNDKMRDSALAPEVFIRSMRSRPPIRVPGTAVFMHRDPDAIPASLLHSLKHYKALHEKVILLTIITEDVAHVPAAERIASENLGEGIVRINARFGYMEEVDVPALLSFCPEMETTYFLGRETLIVTDLPSGMMSWRERVFAWMMRNAASAANYFRLPPNRVVELGAQIEF